jgi:hypothetical protein
MQAGELLEAKEVTSTERQDLAKLIVTRLIVPYDQGGTEEEEERLDKEILKRTVDLVSREDVGDRRADFQQFLASLDAEGLRDETIIWEVEDKLDAFNEVIRRHTRAQRARIAVQIVKGGEATAGLWVPPMVLSRGPTAAVGDAIIERRWATDRRTHR